MRAPAGWILRWWFCGKDIIKNGRNAVGHPVRNAEDAARKLKNYVVSTSRCPVILTHKMSVRV